MKYASILIMTLAWQDSVASANSPILLPGAPGEGSRDLSAEQAIAIANASYTKNDVRIM